ncbi:hypothetical protein KDA23_01060 [Candidatus Saccharibacteria bacterium]|nr:hypothetical protein [Candidatus Saccharibacteria bacterium]
MEPMSIRELVAWVLVFGLVVTLVSSRMKARTTSSKSSLKKALKHVELTKPKTILEEPDVPDTSIWDQASEYIETPPKTYGSKKGGTNAGKMEGVPKRDSKKQSRRGWTDKVRRSQNGATNMRNRKGAKSNGPAPHKGKK